MEPFAAVRQRPRIRLPWWSGIVALPLLASLAVFALEQRIELIGADTMVYIKRVPGDDVRYRLDADAPWTPVELDQYSYDVEVGRRMPKRGLLPIQVSYRTWIGFRRTRWLGFDVDQSLSVHYEMGFWSGGGHSLAHFKDEGRLLRIEQDETAGCLTYRYGFDNEPANHPLAPGTFDIAVPTTATSVTVRPIPCKKAHVCAVTFYLDNRDSEISKDDCQSR